MLKKIYIAIGILTLSMYAASGLLGWELRGNGRRKLDQTARSSPGGIRGFHFWHSGYHGGK